MDVYSSIFDVTNTIISSVILFYAFTVYVSFFYVAHFPTYVLPAPPTCIMFFENNWGKITVWREANGCSGEKKYVRHSMMKQGRKTFRGHLGGPQ